MFCFFKQKTAYEMRISDWSSDVCSSDLDAPGGNVAEIHGSGAFVRVRADYCDDFFRTGFTLSPGLRKAPASTTTRSFPVKPEAIDTPLSVTVPTFTGRRSIWSALFTTRTKLPSAPLCTALSGSSGACPVPATSRPSAKPPGPSVDRTSVGEVKRVSGQV